jgi:hypothetical protein
MCLSSRGLTIDWEKFRHFQVGNSCWNTWFHFSNIWTFLHYYLVVYVVRRCLWNSTFVDAQNFRRSICVYLGMSVMHCNNKLTHMLSLLLFEGFGSRSTCLQTPYGHRDQTLLINDEPSKALWNSKWNKLFLEPFRGCELSKNKVQWLDLASQLWPLLKGFPCAKMVHAHFIVLM